MGSRLRCPTCSRTYPLSSLRSHCDCGDLLDVHHDPPDLSVAELRSRFRARWVARSHSAASPVSGVWRYHELLAPRLEEEPISLHEGDTPLYRHAALCEWAGIPQLWLKHEGMNPTGSFKDRGMTVAVSIARSLGAKAFLCASTGNTAASLAAYGAAAGKPVFVLAPRGKVAAGKITQTLAFGATIVEVEGDFDRALAVATALAKDGGFTLLNSVNPLRIEGQKSAAFEIAEAFEWDPPDWVVLPAGNLGNLSAYGKAFQELLELGLISRPPRLAGVQAKGANPFYRSYLTGFQEQFSVQADTVATAIRIGAPASFRRAVRAIRRTDGVVEQVSDEEILSAKRVVDLAGLGCEPASAAALAGARKLAQARLIRAGHRVVVVLTGNLLKDPDTVQNITAASRQRVTLPADQAKILQFLERQMELRMR